MIKHFATVTGVALATTFIAVFFIGRAETKNIREVAPRVGMSYDDLMSMGPRIAAHTGATLGTSRRVIYLLACSGRATRETLEQQALQANGLTIRKRLSDREAVVATLTPPGAAPLDLAGC